MNENFELVEMCISSFKRVNNRAVVGNIDRHSYAWRTMLSCLSFSAILYLIMTYLRTSVQTLI